MDHILATQFAILAATVLMGGGFAEAMSLAGEGDDVYCGPPYADHPDQESLAAYLSAGFGLSTLASPAAAAIARPLRR